MENISRRTFLASAAGAVLAPPPRRAWPATVEVPTLLDHILLGCNHLENGIAFVEEYTGVRAAFGGVHQGRGTQNALLSLGELRYLEIIAPDPAQAGAADTLGLRNLVGPQIIGWAAHPGDLETLANKLREGGVPFEGPTACSRLRPDGLALQWKTLNLKDTAHGLLPFFIEWSAGSVHPSVDAPSGCTLARFEAFSAEADELTKLVELLRLDIRIEKAKAPRLSADLASSKGGWAISS